VIMVVYSFYSIRYITILMYYLNYFTS